MSPTPPGQWLATRVNHKASDSRRFYLAALWWTMHGKILTCPNTVQRNKGGSIHPNEHAPCRCALSCILFQPSDEHPAPLAWVTSSGYYQFQTVGLERQLLRLTGSSKRKSGIQYLCIYDIKIKCQRMERQCPACPTGRAVAASIISMPKQAGMFLTVSSPRRWCLHIPICVA